MSTPSEHAPLDLYSICLHLNYECTSTDPRFRHTKLCDIATSSLPFGRAMAPEWISHTGGTKDGFIFEKDSTVLETSPDLPSNMLPSPVPPSLSHLTAKELETIFWQARGHDGCYKSVSPAAFLRSLRIHPSACAPLQAWIMLRRPPPEFKLLQPKRMTILHVVGGQEYINGDEDAMMHAVVGFSALGNTNATTVLDLSSLQFGDAGRGLGGRSTFALESVDAFCDRLEVVARDANMTKVSQGIRSGPNDAWLQGVAKRAKERWEACDVKAWCGHCGVPGEAFKRCSLCHTEPYCNEAHSAAAWPFHRRFCSSNKK
ncbi:hypothetical protein B0H13DRAFT_2014108 [Mycena leptocephala]|nr:hypothetical protein B0H13DRAFT_2014108 [Mycena leptocephala]